MKPHRMRSTFQACQSQRAEIQNEILALNAEIGAAMQELDTLAQVGAEALPLRTQHFMGLCCTETS